MRKILISVLVGLMLICSIFFIMNGFAKFKIEGIKGIQKKDQEIDSKITELSSLINSGYTGAESSLKQSATKLTNAKTEYENQAALSNSIGSSYASNLEKYDLDYLWTRLGNYAKDESVVIRIDVTAGGASSNLYNLNFNVIGSYVGATDFIYDIENDSKLGFKIDGFKMISNSGAEVEAAFVCKDIPINVGNIETTQTTNGNANTENNNTQTTANPNNNMDNGDPNTANRNNSPATDPNINNGRTESTSRSQVSAPNDSSTDYIEETTR